MRLTNILVVSLAMLMVACGGSSPGDTDSTIDRTPDQAQPPPVVGEQRAGTNYRVELQSASGFPIVFQVFEPVSFVGGAKYPLIMHGHGFGGSRTSAPTGLIGRLVENDYAVISFDQRGFGESGGPIRLMDPEFEVQDIIQILDWVDENLDYILRRPGPNGQPNIVLGGIGSSYGGGFQLMVHANDPKQRFDALAPDITWNNLAYSVYNGNVVKWTWVEIFYPLGVATSEQGWDPGYTQIYTIGTTTNNPPPELVDELLYKHSFRRYCDANTVEPIDVMLSQGFRDTLFTFNEAYENFLCLDALGGDVRLLTHQSGHLLPGLQAGAGEMSCDGLAYDDAVQAWFDEKLKLIPGAASSVPGLCMSLADGDGISLNSATGNIPVGGNSADADPRALTGQTQAVVVNQALAAAQSAVVFDLGVAGSEGAVIAGIPTASIEVAPTVGGEEVLAEPILFLGLGVSRNGTISPLDEQLIPLRGYGTHEVQLAGIGERLATGETVSLLVYGFHQYYAGVATRLLPPSNTVQVTPTVNLPLMSGVIDPLL